MFSQQNQQQQNPRQNPWLSFLQDECKMSDVSLMKICRFYGPGPQGGDLGAPRPMHHYVNG